MRATHSIQFYCRQSKASRITGLAHIEASIIISGNRVFINLPREEKPEEFKKAIQSRKHNDIKDYLDEVRSKFKDIELDMMRNNIPLTSSNLREYWKSGGVKTYTVGDLFKEYLDLLSKRVGRTLTQAAYKKYQNAFDAFLKFCPATTELSAITKGTMEKFLIDCQSKFKDSTTAGILTKVKTAFAYARDCNKIQINPFAGIKYSRGTKEIEYLTEDEIETLRNAQIDNKSLSDVRDAFILQAATGLSYADIYKLKKEDIHIEEDGTHYIVQTRQKTQNPFTTVVLPMGVEVLQKHDYQLHIISNQKYNLYLHSIQSLTGIEKNLTTHLARKTFACTLINRGVRMEAVSKCLAHKSVKITERYYAELNRNSVIEEVKAAF